jgi:hypothetical protein
VASIPFRSADLTDIVVGQYLLAVSRVSRQPLPVALPYRSAPALHDPPSRCSVARLRTTFMAIS